MNVFPGGTAVTDLIVYDAASIDGRCGGSPHLHTASSEGYVVIGGSGAVETLSSTGFEEHPLRPGEVVWFSPGTVHRLINAGDLRLIVVMSNAGLPEAGDAVFTFSDDLLADPACYASVSALPDSGDPDELAHAVATRRDLAVAGFAALRAAVEAGDTEAWRRLHERATRLVQPRLERWRRIWEGTVAAETDQVRAQLDALAAGRPGRMGEARVTRGVPRGGERAWGMCGRLATWEWTRA